MTFNVNLTNTIPHISNSDIKRTYMYRYFASKANQLNEVYEISRRDYEILIDNQYIILGHIKWLIKGTLEDKVLNLYTGHALNPGGLEPIIIPGVLTQNKASTIFLSKKLPAITKYLTDYKQFYISD